MFFIIDEERVLNIIDKEFRLNTSSSLNWYIDANYLLHIFIDVADCKHTYMFTKQLDESMSVDFRIKALLRKDNSVLGTIEFEDKIVEIPVQQKIDVPIQEPVVEPNLLKAIWGFN